MTPTDLAAYLAAFRAANAMSAELKLPGGAEIRVVLGPDMPPAHSGEPIDQERPAGAWKSWAGDDE